MSMQKLVGIFGIFCMIMIISSYLYGISAAVDTDLNIEDSEYQEQYDHTTKVLAGTEKLLTPLSYIVMVLMLFVGFGYIRKVKI